MNRKLWIAASLLVPLALGCVRSVNPVYDREHSTFEDGMLGTWKQADAETRWVFSRQGTDAYTVVVRGEDGQVTRFDGHLARFDDLLLLDLQLEKGSGLEKNFEFYYLPTHLIFRVSELGGQQLTLSSLDMKWLNDYLTENPDAIPNTLAEPRQHVLTGSTEQVQEFLVKHADRFTGGLRLVRQ